MKKRKGIGPDDVPIDVMKLIGDPAVYILTEILNYINKGEPMPDDWRKSVLIPLYKNKGDALSCNNYRGFS